MLFVTLGCQLIKAINQHSTNITDKQWQFIENTINLQGRSEKYLRGIMYTIFLTRYSILLKPVPMALENPV